ncbi:hypothetical protein [Bizionia arctica]|uniref:Uncharacterized protein n=1 Tax=Bizionia arctica TaxID=1495645 RepID=A0A917GW82_9FLAO|nr:hypothetical protein [Bizionia arctica]GGG59077.1 hypothetical protein GCM10010976_32290 [Bizionia arctica]
METNNDINQKVQNTLKSFDSITDTKVSPFFKDKTMQLLFSEKEEKESFVFSWFSPKLQFATLVCFVLLNVFAYVKINSNTYNSNVQDFAETYGLSTDNDTYLLN